MTVFYLIRHGCKVPDTPGDVGLTELGRRQAEATARHLARVRPAAIYASPARRTQETAEAFATVYELPVKTAPALRERAEWDDPNLSWEDFMAIIERASLQRSWQPPIGDSSRGAGDRMARFLRELTQRHPGRKVIIISHGGNHRGLSAERRQPQDATGGQPRLRRQPLRRRHDARVQRHRRPLRRRQLPPGDHCRR
jgi:2,3-bisphosphoglycerate-dependent phosphoglycerate mutase